MLNLYNFSHTNKKNFNITASKRISLALRGLVLASAIVFTIISTIIVFMVVSMGILPAKYFAIVVAGVVLFSAVGFLMFFISKKHKVPAIIVSVILLVISGFMCLGLSYLFSTKDFFNQTKAREYYTVKYSVLVHKDSEYQELSELNDKRYASYVDTVTSYTEAFEELKQIINFNAILHDTYLNAASAFMRGEADFIMLSDSYVGIIEDMEEGFSEKIRSIHTIEVKVYDAVEVSDVDVLNEPFNIYISGIDVEGDISQVSRSDVNMIVTVNPKTHKVLLTSIPRDFYMQLHGTTGLKDKLTHSGIYGPTMTVKTVEDFLNIKINYFIRVNFSSVVNLVNAIGGVYLTPNFTFYRAYDGNNCWYNEGVTTWYNGACALRYARERKAYGTGDIQRIQNQQHVLTAILNKILSPEIIKNYSSILSAVQNNFETSIPEQKIYQLINNQLDNMPKWEVLDCHMEGYDSHSDIYSYGKYEAGNYGANYYYVMEPNYDTVEAAKAKIKEVFEGQ